MPDANITRRLCWYLCPFVTYVIQTRTAEQSVYTVSPSQLVLI